MRIMSCLEGQQQSAFVFGRDIVDNVLFMQEMVRNYHRDGRSPRCAFVVGIRKAYDSVQRDFLWVVMAAMQFPMQVIGWIKQCVTTTHFSISIIGVFEGYLGKKGP